MGGSATNYSSLGAFLERPNWSSLLRRTCSRDRLHGLKVHTPASEDMLKIKPPRGVSAWRITWIAFRATRMMPKKVGFQPIVCRVVGGAGVVIHWSVVWWLNWNLRGTKSPLSYQLANNLIFLMQQTWKRGGRVPILNRNCGNLSRDIAIFLRGPLRCHLTLKARHCWREHRCSFRWPGSIGEPPAVTMRRWPGWDAT
jgi:hypothetical protein